MTAVRVESSLSSNTFACWMYKSTSIIKAAYLPGEEKEMNVLRRDAPYPGRVEMASSQGRGAAILLFLSRAQVDEVANSFAGAPCAR